ncbi:MAG: NMD3-related protein [Candidatus Micrarchaeota archaeon]
MIICPKCGRSNVAAQFIDAFCVDCYPFKVKLPDVIEIQLCKRCGRMRFKGDWQEYDSEAIEHFVQSKCRGDYDSVHYELERGILTFVIKRGDHVVEISKPYSVKTTISICPDCSRKSGGYFQAIIQLRGNPDKIKKYEKLFTAHLSQSTFISKTEQKKEGVDLYVGNSKTVVSIMNELGLRTEMSHKLAGELGGKRIYRTTFLVRFDEKKGDRQRMR